MKKKEVIIHFADGAFVVTFGHEFSGRPAADILTQHLKVSLVLWAHNWLAEDEETRLPGAIKDAFTFYCYVLSLGFERANMILSISLCVNILFL